MDPAKIYKWFWDAKDRNREVNGKKIKEVSNHVMMGDKYSGFIDLAE
jgi:hypothetical protein